MNAIILILLLMAGESSADMSCSINDFRKISPDIKAEYDAIYPNKLSEAQSALQRNGGSIDVGHRVFTRAEDYAAWASKMDATELVSKNRVGELEDVIRESWRKSGHSEAQIDGWIQKLNNKVESGQAVWERGNFRYVNRDGTLQGSHLVPDDLQKALSSSQKEIAETAAKIGDEGAREVVQEIYNLDLARDAIAKKAQSQNWVVGEVRGNTVVEIQQINSGDAIGKKILDLADAQEGQKMFLSFTEDGRSVSFHIVDQNNQLIREAKNVTGTEFYNSLFK